MLYLFFIFFGCFNLMPYKKTLAASQTNQKTHTFLLEQWIENSFIPSCRSFFSDPKHPQNVKPIVQTFFDTFFDHSDYTKVLHTVLRQAWKDAPPAIQQELIQYCKNYLIDFCLESVCVFSLKDQTIFLQKIQQKSNQPEYFSVFLSGDLISTKNPNQTFEFKLTLEVMNMQGQWKLVDMKPYDQSILLIAEEKTSRWLQNCRVQLSKSSPTAQEFLAYLKQCALLTEKRAPSKIGRK